MSEGLLSPHSGFERTRIKSLLREKNLKILISLGVHVLLEYHNPLFTGRTRGAFKTCEVRYEPPLGLSMYLNE